MNRFTITISTYYTRAFRWCRARTELLFWLMALLLLFFLPVGGTGISLCAFEWIGFPGCPGCGIGHAIHHALHLNLRDSFSSHPMGIPAVIIIFIRIKQLLYPTNQTNETQPYYHDPRP
mgnify:CR=1 FL=1